MKLSIRARYLLAFIFIAILIGVAFYLEKYEGLIPCPLCVLERITLALLGIIFFFGATSANKKIYQLLIAILASIFSLLGIVLSGRQVWLQHLPPDKHADCGVSLNYLMNVLPFHQVVARIFQGTAECAQKSWEFLNLSLAEWSLICFIGFFIFSLVQCKICSKTYNPPMTTKARNGIPKKK